MSDTKNNRIARVREILTARCAPTVLEITDESARHAGHPGATSGPHTHIAITIRSPSFSGLGRLDIHRTINAALAEEFANGLHAVRIDAAGVTGP